MTTATAIADLKRLLREPVFVIKWTASILQIVGYSATAFGLIGWFIVGVLWNDKALMLIHLVALGAMTAGVLS